MELAVSTLSIYNRRDGDVINLIREHPDIKNWEILDEGYHRLDNNLIRELKAMSRNNIRFSVHAPFSSINLSESDISLRTKFLELVLASIDRAAEIDARVVVVHAGHLSPFTFWFPDEAAKALSESLQVLAKRGKANGVKIAVETGMRPWDMFNKPEDMARYLDGIEGIWSCIDTGHASVNGDVISFIQGSPRLYHAHIHDNSGEKDEHLPPGRGSINWQGVFKQFREMDYRGWLVAENHSLEEALEGLDFIKKMLKGF